MVKHPQHHTSTMTSFIDMFELHRTKRQAQKEFGPDCFHSHFHRSMPPLQESFLICVRCPLLCGIVYGDENYHQWELERSAASSGITVEELYRLRKGLIQLCSTHQRYYDVEKDGGCPDCEVTTDA